MLQMSATQILTEVNNCLQENPALEEFINGDNNELAHKLEEEDKREIIDDTDEEWYDLYESHNDSYYKPKYADDINYENFISKEVHLTEHLLLQLNISGLSKEQKEIGEYIIGNIDNDGYFRLDIESTCKQLNVDEDQFLKVLKIIQSFDPSGIAARNFKECVLIQLHDMYIEDSILKKVDKILSMYSDRIVNGDYEQIVRELNIDIGDFEFILSIIKKTDPKPGYSFEDSNRYIYPDVYVFESGNGYEVFVNEKDLPHIKVNNYYINLLNDKYLDKDTKKYIEEKVKNAQWFIKSLNNRQSAILKVVKTIVNMQKDFFDKGVHYLKPMRLKDIAEVTGLHESTISRVTSGKYVYCKYGLMDLKLFFVKGYETNAGNISVDRIKETIAGIIEKETQEDPLSDNLILNILKGNGINIARRTIAKYREELKIPSKKYRKKRRVK
jgi:RNA polymerase sigma-54 factor